MIKIYKKIYKYIDNGVAVWYNIIGGGSEPPEC